MKTTLKEIRARQDVKSEASPPDQSRGKTTLFRCPECRVAQVVANAPPSALTALTA